MLFAAAAVILTALAFEHFGGYAPCPLCLQQRYAYYAGMPALFLALVLLSAGSHARAGGRAVPRGRAERFSPMPRSAPTTPARSGNSGRAPTPAAGSQALSTSAGGLLKDLATTRVIRCDEAPWHFLGLSFAGWNVVASLLLAAGAAFSAVKARRG